MGTKTLFHSNTRLAAVAIAALASVPVSGTDAHATEGYFSHGYGARNYALGGAGVADSRDAMALAINPAGIVDVGRQFQGAATLFSPRREYTATGPGFVAPGTVGSRSEYFVVPNLAYNHPMGPNSSIGIAMFGNGGMHTSYPNVANPACIGPVPAPSGVFCGSDAGVDLIQAFVAVGYAHRFGPVSVGVSPVFALQRFRSEGIGVFGFVSSDPTNLSNRSYDYSVGGGARVGAQMEIGEIVRVGASFQTKMYMSKFDRYQGLFEDGGDFDIPANVTAGVAVDVTPDVTLMFDYKRIFYSDVDAVGSATTIPLPLGSSGGPGFGWSDIDIFKVGAEWRMDDRWTFRAGYAYNDNPIESNDVTLNILAPGVVQHHITGGASLRLNDYHTLDFAAMYAPSTKVRGIEVTPFGPNPARTIELEMHQFALTLGWTYNIGPM